LESTLLRFLVTFAVLNVLLLALEIPRHSGFGPNGLALEALLLAGIFAFLPRGRFTQLLSWLVGGTTAFLVLLALADALALASLSRRVNIYLDYPLARSVYHLIAGSVSVTGAIVAGAALALLLLLLAFLVHRLLLAASGHGAAVRLLGLVFALVGVWGITAFHAGPALNNLPRAITPGITLVYDQFRFGRSAHFEQNAFAETLAGDTASATPVRLERLADTDVILGFIESYGVSAIFDERYSPVLGPTLDTLEQRVEAAGLHMVTGLLNAPMFGGQSWLAHATLLSGLWIPNQMRYEFLLQTERETLVTDFTHTGHRTVAIMPALTLPWPEGQWYRFDEVHTFHDIPYAGPPFNWVTMPDQYTWSFFERNVRQPGERPIFAKLALISSHAPWVPILPVLEDWEMIGDGGIYRQWEGTGEAPESLWRDPDRVREHYARSVAYAVETAGAFAVRHVDKRTLLIVLGDHQSAAIITSPNASPAVPVHVISGDSTLLQPFRARGFVPGAWPAAETTEFGMDRLRDWLHQGFAREPPTLFDTHLHYNRPHADALPPEEIAAALERTGIARAVVSSRNPELLDALMQAAPGRIVPFLDVYASPAHKAGWMFEADLAERVRDDLDFGLASGDWQGIGELHLFAGERHAVVFQQLVELAAARNLPVMIHGDPAVIDRAFELEPDLRILWAHAGTFPYPDLIRDYVTRYPQLLVDLSMRSPRLNPPEGMPQEWRDLLIEHADRFLIGVDTFSVGRWRDLDVHASEIRAWLDALPDDVARQIAWENAREHFP
jgi:hypothetical protein